MMLRKYTFQFDKLFEHQSRGIYWLSKLDRINLIQYLESFCICLHFQLHVNFLIYTGNKLDLNLNLAKKCTF